MESICEPLRVIKSVELRIGGIMFQSILRTDC